MSELFIPFSLVKDKVKYSRKIVFKLAKEGKEQKEIAKELPGTNQ